MKERKEIGERAKIGVLTPSSDRYTPEPVDIGRRVRFKIGMDAEDAQTVKVYATWLVGVILFAITLGISVRLFLIVSGLGG